MVTACPDDVATASGRPVRRSGDDQQASIVAAQVHQHEIARSVSLT